MTRKRKWIGGSLLTLMLALAVGGWWLWQSFVWVFFVKPGDGGKQWSLPITAVAGDPGGQSGFRDGAGAEALLAKPIRLASLDAGTVVFADINNHAIRTGSVSTLCGTTEKGLGEGRLNRPAAVLAQQDTLWIADSGNHRIVTVPLPAPPPPLSPSWLGRLAPGRSRGVSPREFRIANSTSPANRTFPRGMPLRFELRADATSACFDALGRSTHLADWQAKLTTMIYLHVMKRPGASAPSPLDFG